MADDQMGHLFTGSNLLPQLTSQLICVLVNHGHITGAVSNRETSRSQPATMRGCENQVAIPTHILNVSTFTEGRFADLS
jgi:hypothetical protein